MAHFEFASSSESVAASFMSNASGPVTVALRSGSPMAGSAGDDVGGGETTRLRSGGGSGSGPGTPRPLSHVGSGSSSGYADSNGSGGGSGGGGGNGVVEQSSDSFFIQQMGASDILYQPRRLSPKVIGPYVLGDVLGEGSYGKVREGFCSITLRRVAVKIMKKKRLKKIPGGEENVRQEIHLLRRLHHTNVVELYDVLYNEEKQKTYVVFEYCQTGMQEMLEHAERHRFAPAQAQRYFAQLIDGLEYLFSQGVIHRDVKPSNLLIKRGDILKISDFGVAEVLPVYQADDICTSSAGSPAFQPPEIASGAERFRGRKVDIWAAGVTLYHMLTGAYPFQGENLYNLFENIATGEFEVPADVPKEAEDLIRLMLRKDPDERPDIADIRAHPWLRTPIPRTPALEVPLRRRVRPQESLYLQTTTTLLPYLQYMYHGEAPAADEPNSPQSDVNMPASPPPETPKDAPKGLSRLFRSLTMRLKKRPEIEPAAE